MLDLTDAAAIKEIRQDDIVIAFVGPSGSGKTHLIDLLANRQRKQTRLGGLLSAKGNGEVHAVRVRHKAYGDRIILLDTPGFESGHHGDIAFLQTEQKIRSWLHKHCGNVTLTGIVYLQQITNPHGPSNRVKAMYKDLCGGGSMSRIILLTTMWHEIKREAGKRHHEGFSHSWNSLTNSESSVHRFQVNVQGNSDHAALRQNAWDLILPLIKRQDEHDSSLLKNELDNLEKELCKTEEGGKLWAPLKEILRARLEVQRELSHLEYRAHINGELNNEEEQLNNAIRYLNRFESGAGDHSVLLTRLVSLTAR